MKLKNNYNYRFRISDFRFLTTETWSGGAATKVFRERIVLQIFSTVNPGRREGGTGLAKSSED
jgi:hypothetical protein